MNKYSVGIEITRVQRVIVDNVEGETLQKAAKALCRRVHDDIADNPGDLDLTYIKVEAFEVEE